MTRRLYGHRCAAPLPLCNGAEWGVGATTRNGANLAADPTLTGGGSRGTLIAWRLDAAGLSLAGPSAASVRPALAPVPVPSGARIGSKAFPLPPGGSETVLVDPGLITALAMPEGVTNSSAPDRQIRPADFAPSRSQRSEIWLAPGRTFERFRVSFLLRAASRHRVEAVPKSLLRRRPFSLCLGRANPRLDVWKLRLATDSGKRGNRQLSTIGANASGQRWISPPLVAGRPGYPRSRWASRRRRRALSLMNPAASFWS
jgi:hypothetical protein